VKSKLTCVAYYLGQFHPIAENDSFWGPGFTEWHNVSKARPLYPGHVQPVLPGKLGFYDLRCKETLTEQIEYAQQIGIHAFCHWHYWFAGKRVLHEPLDMMVRMDHPTHKFMLGWANESWSGIWHGAAHRVLIEQTYNRTELAEHARLIAGYIKTGKYLELDNQFPFVIYKPRQIPNAAEYLLELKRLVHQLSGSNLYVIGNWSPGRTGSFKNPAEYGLDAAVITPIGARFNNTLVQLAYSGWWHGLRKLRLGPELRSYSEAIPVLERSVREFQGTAHASVVTGWDNTPRSGRRGLVLRGYNRDTLRKAAAHALSLELKNPVPLLFLKSWNEWAEGNVLEPRYNETWSAGEVLREVLNGV
jgi:hypothetical protein